MATCPGVDVLSGVVLVSYASPYLSAAALHVHGAQLDSFFFALVLCTTVTGGG